MNHTKRRQNPVMPATAAGQEPILTGGKGRAASLWAAVRPYQWFKNLFVLVPLLFAQQLFIPTAAAEALLAAVLFCLVSSSVYLFNDIQDRDWDRFHPQKRNRPLAAGELSVPAAHGAGAVLLLLALATAMLLDRTFASVLAGYWLLNFLYSRWLKRQVILDVFSIAAGFVLRVVGGAVVIRVQMSHWLLICTTLLALFLGFSKRRCELVQLGEAAEKHRQVLDQYSLRFLDIMIGVVTASTVVSYALYTVSEETVHKFHTRGLLLTLPFVLYGLFRYLYLVYHKDYGGDPAQHILRDLPSVFNLGLWVVAAGIILYWP